MNPNDIPSMYAGDSKYLVFTVYDDKNNILDITGCKFKWKLDSKSHPINKDSSTGDVTITNSVQGEVTVKLNPDDTNTLGGGVFLHELEMTDANGNVSTVLHDRIRMLTALI